MAGSLPILLLALVVPAAVATVGLQPAGPCQPALTAWEISRVCADGRPTARCCARVVAVVELGGGVPCLCRVAAEPELATLTFRRVLTSCGGARLTATCDGADHNRAVVKATPLPRRKLVAASVRSSNGTCPSATEWATSVAVACGQSISDQGPCCAALDKAIPMSKSKVVECICTLESTPPIQKVRLQARNLINDFASCMSMRAGDVHFPSDGCASVPPKIMVTPAPSAVSPAAGTLSPPGVPAASAPTYALPSNQRDSTRPGPSKSKDHAILVGILVTLVVFGGLVCIGAGGYAIYKYRGGWVLLGRARANEQQPNIFIINNYNAARRAVSTQPEVSTSSTTTDAALSTAVSNVTHHTTELQRQFRRSGRLAGEEPANAGLQFS